MNKTDIIEKVAKKGNRPAMEVEVILNAILYEINHALINKERVEIRNFGIFKVVKRKARLARNWTTQERMEVPARLDIIFKPGEKVLRKLRMRASQSVYQG